MQISTDQKMLDKYGLKANDAVLVNDAQKGMFVHIPSLKKKLKCMHKTILDKSSVSDVTDILKTAMRRLHPCRRFTLLGERPKTPPDVHNISCRNIPPFTSARSATMTLPTNFEKPTRKPASKSYTKSSKNSLPVLVLA
jgi:hypothetical protein